MRMNKENIEKEITSFGDWVEEVIFFEETTSTNEYAKSLGRHGLGDNLKGKISLVVADGQTGGKGTKGRNFLSPKGTSIYMSILQKPDIKPTCASMITIVTAVAVRRAIEEETGVDAKIKWPNDIVAQNKKLCGILTEMNADVEKVKYLVIGIGLNVNNSEMSRFISDIAVSLRMITGKEYDRSKIIGSIVKWYKYYFEKFIEKNSLELLVDEYNKNLIHNGWDIMLLKGNETEQVKSHGINEFGQLIVEKEGEKFPVISGEVSVRGIYNYV